MRAKVSVFFPEKSFSLGEGREAAGRERMERQGEAAWRQKAFECTGLSVCARVSAAGSLSLGVLTCVLCLYLFRLGRCLGYKGSN